MDFQIIQCGICGQKIAILDYGYHYYYWVYNATSSVITDPDVQMLCQFDTV